MYKRRKVDSKKFFFFLFAFYPLFCSLNVTRSPQIYNHEIPLGLCLLSRPWVVVPLSPKHLTQVHPDEAPI